MRPGLGVSRSFTPKSDIGLNLPSSAPNIIIITVMGMRGDIFLKISIITTVERPRTKDRRLKFLSADFIISGTSSKSSPRSASPPKSLGTCISIISQPMPVMKPPITGEETKRVRRSALNSMNSPSQNVTHSVSVGIRLMASSENAVNPRE